MNFGSVFGGQNSSAISSLTGATDKQVLFGSTTGNVTSSAQLTFDDALDLLLVTGDFSVTDDLIVGDDIELSDTGRIRNAANTKYIELSDADNDFSIVSLDDLSLNANDIISHAATFFFGTLDETTAIGFDNASGIDIISVANIDIDAVDINLVALDDLSLTANDVIYIADGDGDSILINGGSINIETTSVYAIGQLISLYSDTENTAINISDVGGVHLNDENGSYITILNDITLHSLSDIIVESGDDISLTADDTISFTATDININGDLVISGNINGDVDFGGEVGIQGNMFIYANNYIAFAEGTTPAAPSANQAVIFCKDTGAKTQLCARFPTGAVQVIATEP